MSQSELIYCPFCNKKTVSAVYRAGYLGFRTSRGSGQSSTQAKRVSSTYLILSGCSVCGKTQKEIEKDING